MTNDSPPPHGGETEPAGPPPPRRVVTVVSGLVVLAALIVGGLLVARGVAAGRAGDAGECRPGQSGQCLERRTVMLDEVRSDKRGRTWDADGLASSFTTDRRQNVDYGLRDGATVDLLTFGDRVVVVETRRGRFELSSGGYRGAVLWALVAAGVALLAGGTLWGQLRPSKSTRVYEAVAGAVLGVMIAVAVVLSSASLAVVLIAAGCAAPLGAVIAVLVGHDQASRRGAATGPEATESGADHL